MAQTVRTQSLCGSRTCEADPIKGGNSCNDDTHRYRRIPSTFVTNPSTGVTVVPVGPFLADRRHEERGGPAPCHLPTIDIRHDAETNPLLCPDARDTRVVGIDAQDKRVISLDVKDSPQTTHVISLDVEDSPQTTHVINLDVQDSPQTTHVISLDVEDSQQTTHVISLDVQDIPQTTHVISLDDQDSPQTTHVMGIDVEDSPQTTHVISLDVEDSPQTTHVMGIDVEDSPQTTHVISLDVQNSPQTTHVISLDVQDSPQTTDVCVDNSAFLGLRGQLSDIEEQQADVIFDVETPDHTDHRQHPVYPTHTWRFTNQWDVCFDAASEETRRFSPNSTIRQPAANNTHGKDGGDTVSGDDVSGSDWLVLGQTFSRAMWRSVSAETGVLSPPFSPDTSLHLHHRHLPLAVSSSSSDDERPRRRAHGSILGRFRVIGRGPRKAGKHSPPARRSLATPAPRKGHWYAERYLRATLAWAEAKRKKRQQCLDLPSMETWQKESPVTKIQSVLNKSGDKTVLENYAMLVENKTLSTRVSKDALTVQDSMRASSDLTNGNSLKSAQLESEPTDEADSSSSCGNCVHTVYFFPRAEMSLATSRIAYADVPLHWQDVYGSKQLPAAHTGPRRSRASSLAADSHTDAEQQRKKAVTAIHTQEQNVHIQDKIRSKGVTTNNVHLENQGATGRAQPSVDNRPKRGDKLSVPNTVAAGREDMSTSAFIQHDALVSIECDTDRSGMTSQSSSTSASYQLWKQPLSQPWTRRLSTRSQALDSLKKTPSFSSSSEGVRETVGLPRHIKAGSTSEEHHRQHPKECSTLEKHHQRYLMEDSTSEEHHRRYLMEDSTSEEHHRRYLMEDSTSEEHHRRYLMEDSTSEEHHRRYLMDRTSEEHHRQHPKEGSTLEEHHRRYLMEDSTSEEHHRRYLMDRTSEGSPRHIKAGSTSVEHHRQHPKEDSTSEEHHRRYLKEGSTSEGSPRHPKEGSTSDELRRHPKKDSTPEKPPRHAEKGSTSKRSTSSSNGMLTSESEVGPLVTFPRLSRPQHRRYLGETSLGDPESQQDEISAVELRRRFSLEEYVPSSPFASPMRRQPSNRSEGAAPLFLQSWRSSHGRNGHVRQLSLDIGEEWEMVNLPQHPLRVTAEDDDVFVGPSTSVQRERREWTPLRPAGGADPPQRPAVRKKTSHQTSAKLRMLYPHPTDPRPFRLSEQQQRDVLATLSRADLSRLQRASSPLLELLREGEGHVQGKVKAVARAKVKPMPRGTSLTSQHGGAGLSKEEWQKVISFQQPLSPQPRQTSMTDERTFHKPVVTVQPMPQANSAPDRYTRAAPRVLMAHLAVLPLVKRRLLPNPFNRVNQRCHSTLQCPCCFFFCFLCCAPALWLLGRSDQHFDYGSVRQAQRQGRRSTLLFVVGGVVAVCLMTASVVLTLVFLRDSLLRARGWT